MRAAPLDTAGEAHSSTFHFSRVLSSFSGDIGTYGEATVLGLLTPRSLVPMKVLLCFCRSKNYKNMPRRLPELAPSPAIAGAPTSIGQNPFTGNSDCKRILKG